MEVQHSIKGPYNQDYIRAGLEEVEVPSIVAEADYWISPMIEHLYFFNDNIPLRLISARAKEFELVDLRPRQRTEWLIGQNGPV